MHLYPDAGKFVCLISVGRKEVDEMELLLPMCTEYITNLYETTEPYNGSRWMMMEVTDKDVLKDVKQILFIRCKPKK